MSKIVRAYEINMGFDIDVDKGFYARGDNSFATMKKKRKDRKKRKDKKKRREIVKGEDRRKKLIKYAEGFVERINGKENNGKSGSNGLKDRKKPDIKNGSESGKKEKVEEKVDQEGKPGSDKLNK